MPDILLITETWLNQNNTIISEYSFKGKYNTVFANRTNKGGGSAILISSKIPFITIFNGTKFGVKFLI